jgi:hypothetical protein
MNQELLEEARRHFNEPMLSGFSLCRCIGYAEDEHDCYLIVSQGGERQWITFVGGYTYLDALKRQNKCLIDGKEWDDFARLDSLLSLNGAPREPEFSGVRAEGILTRLRDETEADISVRLRKKVQP